MSDDLKALKALTGMVLDTELARLQGYTHEAAACRAALRGLTIARRERARQVRAERAPEDDLAFTTGRDAAWQAWLARESVRLATDLAQAAARQEAQRLMARRAFGRVEALRQVQVREKLARAQKTARRFYDGQC